MRCREREVARVCLQLEEREREEEEKKDSKPIKVQCLVKHRSKTLFTLLNFFLFNFLKHIVKYVNLNNNS